MELAILGLSRKLAAYLRSTHGRERPSFSWALSPPGIWLNRWVVIRKEGTSATYCSPCSSHQS
ncbi:hypothetical protein D3C80_2097120 [compost metagenome]